MKGIPLILRTFLPPILSGFLLWIAFFPLDLGLLGFFALVPWLTLVRAPVSRRRRYFAAYLGAFTFFALATNWVRVAHPMMYLSWLGLSLVLPLFWILGLDLIRRFDRLGAPLALSVPVVWVALEYARMHFPTGYPFLKPLGLYQMIGFGWYFLGYTQHSFLQLIQIADIGGVYAVSFLVAAVNGMVADWLFRMEYVRKKLGFETSSAEMAGDGRILAMYASGLVSVLVVSSVGYGFSRLNHPEFPVGPHVAAIQGNVPQGEKMLKGEGSLSKVYGTLHCRARDNVEHRPDMIVWPETCFTHDWFEIGPGQKPPKDVADDAEKCANGIKGIGFGVPTLLGLTSYDWENGKEWRYNSALLLNSRGTKLGRYDKMHLVPFGEYVPLKETFPFLQALTPYDHDYSCRPGEHWTRFPLTASDGRKFTFGCLICYEDSDPYLARQYVASEPVSFLVNISNDGWFNGTEEHEQHLAIAQFRAIEARRALLRSVNMGISALIDSDGAITALPHESWSRSKQTEAVVSADVRIDNRDSWYSHLGDWMPGLCWTLVIVIVVISRLRKTQTAAV
jgi:apolipoprotein N-acyltransferase